VFVLDTRIQHITVKEANRLGIPVVAMTEEPGWLRSMVSQRVEHDLATESTHVTIIELLLPLLLLFK